MKIEDDEIITSKKDKSSGKRTTTIIATLIVLLIIVVIGITYAIITIKGKKLSLSVDGQKVNFAEDTFLFTNDRKNLCLNKRYSATCWI